MTTIVPQRNPNTFAFRSHYEISMFWFAFDFLLGLLLFQRLVEILNFEEKCKRSKFVVSEFRMLKSKFIL